MDLPIIAKMNKSSTHDLSTAGVLAGRLRHVDVCMFFLCELKDNWTVVFKHILVPCNEADIFTKNAITAMLQRQSAKLCGNMVTLK